MTKKAKGFWGELVDEEVASRIASIIGARSSYGLALEDAKRRRANGEDVVLMNTGSSVVVVPTSCITNVTQLPRRAFR